MRWMPGKLTFFTLPFHFKFHSFNVLVCKQAHMCRQTRRIVFLYFRFQKMLVNKVQALCPCILHHGVFALIPFIHISKIYDQINLSLHFKIAQRFHINPVYNWPLSFAFLLLLSHTLPFLLLVIKFITFARTIDFNFMKYLVAKKPLIWKMPTEKTFISL